MFYIFLMKSITKNTFCFEILEDDPLEVAKSESLRGELNQLMWRVVNKLKEMPKTPQECAWEIKTLIDNINDRKTRINWAEEPVLASNNRSQIFGLLYQMHKKGPVFLDDTLWYSNELAIDTSTNAINTSEIGKLIKYIDSSNRSRTVGSEPVAKIKERLLLRMKWEIANK